jgi:hypothetical protein
MISSYTSSAPKACTSINAVSDPNGGFVRVCPGIGNLLLLNSEDDLRETVSVGRTQTAAASEPAAKHWFAPFSSTTPTIEWRHPKGGAPVAIIQRWHLADNNDLDRDGRPRTRALLVVTRLPPGPVCHVAYIDASANADANLLARHAADTARGFDCSKDAVRIEGTRGRAIDLALPR